MKKQLYIATNLVILALFFGAGTAMAQKDTLKLRQEVEVTKAFQPTINEAVKINDIPKIKPEQTEVPTFDYSIYSKPIFSTFEPTPVAAAKMVGDPRPEMGKGLLKLGFGNYLTPYGELFFNAQPDKKSNFGMHFKHLSSYGKLNLLNGDRVEAPQSVNEAEIFGKKFFHKSTLSGSLAFDRKAFTYYGYTGDELTDVQKDQIIPYFGKKQNFSKGTADIRLNSETLSADDLNYDVRLNYHYMVSKTGQKEGQMVFSGDFGKKFGDMFGILNASMTYYSADSIFNRDTHVYGSRLQTLIRVNPSVKWVADNASLQAGLNSMIVFDDQSTNKVMIWPKVKAEWSPVEQVLTLFVAADGYLKHNTYSAIATENPYVDPYHDVANANYKYILSGGFKGKLTPKTNYVAEAAYSVIKDQHFYITNGMDFYKTTSTTRLLNNTFSFIYDDVNVLKLSGEVLHSVSDKFSFHLLGNYYSYDLKTMKTAWQMPNFDVTLSGVFQPSEQLRFNADIFLIGSQTALLNDYSANFPLAQPTAHEISMDPIIDLNVGGEYQFSEKFSFFAKLNNFGFQKYEQWLGYANKGFNAMVGASYKF